MGYIFDALNRPGGPDDPQPRGDGHPDRDDHARPGEPEAPAPRGEAADHPPAPGDPAGYAHDADPLSITSLERGEPIPAGRRIDPSPAQLGAMDDRVAMLTDPGCHFAEEYRAIRTSLLARWQNKRHLVHVITSATPQEGKTITSLNLGLTLAELRSRQTIIVEADLRLPAFGGLLNLDDGPGLVPYLRGEASLEASVHRIGDGGGYVLPAGTTAFDDAVSLLSGPRMLALVEHLRRKFDHVVIDTPPVIELADAGILGGVSDDVLLIARMRRTPKRMIEQAISTLNSYNAPVGGLIATDHTRGFGRYYSHRYRYRYRYGYSRARGYRRERRAA